MLTKASQQQALLTSAEPIAVPAKANFREFLQAELVRRCQANPKYSLRAFARFLGVESSRLSKILRGQRPVSKELLKKLASKLSLSPSQILLFQNNLTESSRYLQLSQDSFESIEDWRHYAILELMKLQDFQADANWVARTLNISVYEARAYIERLQRVGLLEISAEGKWQDRSEGFSTHILSEMETTNAHRKHQVRIMQLAIQAIEETQLDQRDQSSMMMATNTSKLLEAKKRIKKFRRELCEFLEDCETKDTIYQISLSLFPLMEKKS